MANQEIKLDLAKVRNARRIQLTSGEKGTFIPDSNASIFVGEKGIYWTLSAIERREVKEGQTHFVKEYIPKEEYNSMTPEQRREIPIIGSIKDIVRRSEGIASAEPVEVVEGDMPF